MYDRGEEKKCFDDFKEQDSGAEEVISSNVLPALMDFIGSDEFRSQVDRFMSKYASLFESGRKAEGKSGDDVIQEWSHEHKQAFDRYQDTLEQLFTTFAERQKAPLSEIYKCCQDTAEGKYAPLFGEDENQYIVDRIMAFLDFDKFVLSMKRYLSERSSHK